MVGQTNGFTKPSFGHYSLRFERDITKCAVQFRITSAGAPRQSYVIKSHTYVNCYFEMFLNVWEKIA